MPPQVLIYRLPREGSIHCFVHPIFSWMHKNSMVPTEEARTHRFQYIDLLVRSIDESFSWVITMWFIWRKVYHNSVVVDVYSLDLSRKSYKFEELYV